MDNPFSTFLEASGLERSESVDSVLEGLYQQYLNDRMVVPPDIRQILDAMAAVHLHMQLLRPKPKDDEAFRFFLDEQDA